jgi:hypothetical protein
VLEGADRFILSFAEADTSRLVTPEGFLRESGLEGKTKLSLLFPSGKTSGFAVDCLML